MGVDSPILRLAWCEDTWKKIYKIIKKHNSLHKYWIFYAFAKKMYFTKLYKLGKLKGAFQKSKSETARLDYSK